MKNFTVCLLASMIAFAPVSYMAGDNIEDTNLTEMSVSYDKTNETLKTNVANYEIINPNRDSFSISTTAISLNGKAPAATNITVRVYNTRNIQRYKYNLANLPKAEDYILNSEYELESGNFGFFQSHIKLTRGVNKVVVDFNREGVDPIEIIIYSYKTINMSSIM